MHGVHGFGHGAGHGAGHGFAHGAGHGAWHGFALVDSPANAGATSITATAATNANTANFLIVIPSFAVMTTIRALKVYTKSGFLASPGANFIVPSSLAEEYLADLIPADDLREFGAGAI
jgi:hypothetical protein